MSRDRGLASKANPPEDVPGRGGGAAALTVLAITLSGCAHVRPGGAPAAQAMLTRYLADLKKPAGAADAYALLSKSAQRAITRTDFENAWLREVRDREALAQRLEKS